MSGIAQVHAALAEFKKGHDLSGDFTLDENGTLTFVLDDILFVFQYNEMVDSLVLMAGIGTVPEDAQTAIFRQLLNANLFWGETGGCTFAYESSEDIVVMQYSVDTEALDATVFGTIFDTLHTLAKEWRIRLMQWVEAEREGPTVEQFIDGL